MYVWLKYHMVAELRGLLGGRSGGVLWVLEVLGRAPGVQGGLQHIRSIPAAYPPLKPRNLETLNTDRTEFLCF